VREVGDAFGFRPAPPDGLDCPVSPEEKPIDRLSGFSPPPNRGLGWLRGRLRGDHPPGGAGAHDRKGAWDRVSMEPEGLAPQHVRFLLKRDSQEDL
jgi:hypothetical protein